jgi:hypothetical protein
MRLAAKQNNRSAALQTDYIWTHVLRAKYMLVQQIQPVCCLNEENAKQLRSPPTFIGVEDDKGVVCGWTASVV